MTQPAEIVVYSKNRKPQLGVEIKHKLGASIEWVTQTRKMLLDYEVIEPSPFFMLVLPDYFYLWKNATSLEAVPPDYKVDASIIFAYYVEGWKCTPDNMDRYSLRMIITNWLNILSIPEPPVQMEGSNRDWLYDSGLHDAIKDGSVVIEDTE